MSAPPRPYDAVRGDRRRQSAPAPTAAARRSGRRATDAILHDTLHGTAPRSRRRLPAGRRQVHARRPRGARTGRRRAPVDGHRADQRPGRRPRRCGSPRRTRTCPVGRLHSSDPRPVRQGARRPAERPHVRQGRRPAPGWTSSSPRPRSGRTSRTASRGGTRSSTRRTRCAPTRCSPSPGSSSGRCSSGDPGQLDPFSDRRRRAVGGAVVRPVGQRRDHPARPQPRAAAAPPAGLLAAARPRRRRWSRPPSTRTRPFRSGTGPRRPAARLRGAVGRLGPRTGSSTRPPSRAGACWSCPPATRRVRTRRRSRRSPRSYAACWTGGRRDRRSASAEPVAAHRRPRSPSAPPTATRRRPSARPSPELGRARGRHRGHGEPAPGPGVRRDGGPAPAVGPPRRDGLPSGDGPAVRAGLPPPARLHRGLPRGRHRPPGRPPVARSRSSSASR